MIVAKFQQTIYMYICILRVKNNQIKGYANLMLPIKKWSKKWMQRIVHEITITNIFGKKRSRSVPWSVLQCKATLRGGVRGARSGSDQRNQETGVRCGHLQLRTELPNVERLMWDRPSVHITHGNLARKFAWKGTLHVKNFNSYRQTLLWPNPLTQTKFLRPR